MMYLSKKVTIFALYVLCSWLAVAHADEIDERRGVWIDVRTVSEFESGHLPGAQNIGFDRIGAEIAHLGLKPGTPIFLYCKSGRRSGFAKETLEKMGYSRVVNAGGVKEVLRRARLAPELGPATVQ